MNRGRAGVSGLTGRLRTADRYVTVSDSLGAFGNVEPDSMRSNEADRFRVQVPSATPREHPVEFKLHLSGTDYEDSVRFTVRVSEPRRVDPIPDGPRQPPLYWAYDDTDSGYSQRPTYEWVEIRSQGTKLNFANDDAVAVVSLPPEFGPFVYYGQRYTRLSVSADGWVAPDSNTAPNYINTVLPSPAAPPGAICANWDDLHPGYGGAGHAYWYHDAANHRLIVEYDSIAYYSPNSVRDKFEIVFYDTTLAALDGNSVFEFRYMTANRYTSSTVGIQDTSRAIGIRGLFNGSYHAGCWPLEAQRAIRFTTDLPTAVSESPVAPSRNPRRLTVVPNPLAGNQAVVRFSLSGPGRASLRVFDALGRVVLGGSYDVSHDVPYRVPLDLSCLSAGVYLFRLDADGRAETQKLVVKGREGRDRTEVR